MPQNEKNAQDLQDLKISTTSQTNSIFCGYIFACSRIAMGNF